MAHAGNAGTSKTDPELRHTAPREGWQRWAADLGHYDRDSLQNFGRLVVGGALVGVVMLYLFIWIADEVLGQETASLDAAIASSVRGLASPQMDVLATSLSFIGSEAVLIASVALLGLFLFQRRWGAGVMLVLISGGVQLLNDVLKTIFHRTRPEPIAGFIAAGQQYSFPSGHAMVSSAFFLYLGYACWRLVHGIWRVVLVAGLVVLVALIGVARIYLQAHYFTDVVAGYMAGFVWSEAVIIGSQFLVRRRAVRHSGVPAHTLNG